IFTVSGTGQAATGVTGDQFYVTHCLTADSVMNAPGYSVRAASAVGNADDLRLALEYPPYELPIELWREKPSKAMTPRRLARTPHRHDGVWVVHSVYLEKDTMNRDRSYFSHLIQLPASTDPAVVLRSWDAPGWIKEYPTKADKNLPRSRLPIGTAISDETLAAFLSRPQTGPTDLAVVVCPDRLRQDIPGRRELVLRLLQGVILANQEDEERDRLFVHAEPGLVAMLLYAAARILPPAWVADLTFSTFEPAHRGLRDYQLAAVVGTYSGSAGKGLEPDLVSSRGYGLDTLRPERSSKEFSGSFPPGLNELIDLVAEGEWDLLADVHRLIGNERDALGRVTKMVPLARAVARMNSGEPTIDDLLALHADVRGAASLAQRAEKIWPHVRAAAMTDPRIRATFKDWLAEPARLDEFRRDAAKALIRGDLAGWDTRWVVVQEVADAEEAKVQLEKAIKNLDEQLPSLPTTTRSRLRAACAAVKVWPDHHLLAPNSQDELTALLSPQSPAEWQGYACFVVMGPDENNWLLPATAPFRSSLRDRVRRHLLSAPPAVLAGYLKHARRYISSDPVFLYSLLQPHSKASIAFLDRLIDAGAAIVEATDWLKLLADLNVYNAPEWQGFLFQNDHLAKLLAGFRADPAATQIWNNYLDLLSVELFEDDEWEQTLYDQLKKAKQSLGAAGIPLRSVLPEGGPAKLNAIDTLLAVMANPASATGFGSDELLKALQIFWPNDPVMGLRQVYLKGDFDKLDLSRDTRQLDPFAAAFLSCYPINHEYYSARTAVAHWLVLSESCPVETRVAFQVHFVRKYVMQNWHKNILDENRRVPFVPEAEARIRESLAVPVPTSGERYSRPTGGRSSGEEEDAGFSSEVTKRAKKAKGRGRGAARRSRSSGLSGGVLAVIAVGVIALIILIAAVVIKFGGQTKPPEPEPTSPTKTQKPPTNKK
ncbi:MAG TPA: hypothetical protein VG122_23610, partial [Gemmata sp.]|nr:hypothetical protein [Gemmata sp.]